MSERGDPWRGAAPAGAHGGDGVRVARALGVDPATVIDLSMSLNPCPPDVAAAVAARLDVLRTYPDATSATVALAAAIDVDPARLVLTNGGAEAIALVAAEVGVGSIVEPEFSLYRRHLDVVDAGAGRWRSNPSNPLGRLAGADEAAAVWDEAFWPLATGTWTRGDDAAWRLGSLTKLWACPGLRLGYVIAPDPVRAGRIRDRQPQWSVGGLALAAIEPLLAATDLIGWASRSAELRRALATGLAGSGFDVAPTDANWVLVRSAVPLRERLARVGVVVRDCASFGLEATFRVAVPPAAQLDRVLTAFAAAAAAADGTAS